jgi:hypothetical protein
LVVLNAILRAFFDPVASALVADLETGEHRIAAFSLQRVGVNIGWVLGTSAIAPLIAFHLPYGYLFYASALVTLLAAASMVFTPVNTMFPATLPAAVTLIALRALSLRRRSAVAALVSQSAVSEATA